MADYSKSKIYKLVSNYTNDIYIGSTIQPLHQRKANHIADFKRYINGRFHYVTSFKLCEKGQVDIILLEECNFHNKDELRRKEREYIDKLECVNKFIPGRTYKEYYDDSKEKRKQYEKRKLEILNEECIKLNDTNIKPIDACRLIFSFDDKDNAISNNELKAIYNRNKDNFDSLFNMKKILRQLGAVEYRNGYERGLKGIICK